MLKHTMRLSAIGFMLLCSSISQAHYFDIKKNNTVSFLAIDNNEPAQPKNSCYIKKIELHNSPDKIVSNIQSPISYQSMSSDHKELTEFEFGAMIVNLKQTTNRTSYYNYDPDFTLLATNKILEDEAWIFATNTSTYTKLEEIGKIQSFAKYVSENYNITLKDAEEIIYHSFIEARNRNIDPLLLISIISVESTFQKKAKSYAGAVGLTQVMANIHKDLIRRNNINIWSVNGNIQTGADIFSEYLQVARGDVYEALQRYNGSLKDKKRKYSNKVIAQYDDYRKIFNEAI